MEQTTTAVGNIMLARSSPVPGIIRLWKLCWASLNHLCNHMTQSCQFIKSKNRVLNPNPSFKIKFRLTDNHLEVRKLHVEVFLTTRSQIRTERAKNPTQQWLWRGRSSKSCHLSLRGRSNLPPGGERLAGRVIQKSIDTGGMKAQDQTACSTRMTADWTRKKKNAWFSLPDSTSASENISGSSFRCSLWWKITTPALHSYSQFHINATGKTRQSSLLKVNNQLHFAQTGPSSFKNYPLEVLVLKKVSAGRCGALWSSESGE